jgi:hypothetical protein
MADLNSRHPGCEIWANSNWFLGQIAGYVNYQYKVVTQDLAVEAAS